MQSAFYTLMLLAQDAAQKAAENAAPADAPLEAPRQPGLGDSLLLFLPLAVIFFVFMIMPERKRAKQKEQLLSSLKKDDKVVTIGGIYGIVANVRPEDDEVTLKVDENKDVRIRVTKSSIAQILNPKPESDASSKPTA